MTEWTPESHEDRLLLEYHSQVGGRLYTEVATPWAGGNRDWPEGYRNRYIDAIRLKEPSSAEELVTFPNHGEEVLRAVEDTAVELIEVKARLNRPVTGQVLAGMNLFLADFAPAEVQGVVVCEHADPALTWVCEQRDIEVEFVGASE